MNKSNSRAAKLAVPCTFALILGAISMGDANGAYRDCRMCHLDPAPGSAAKDYIAYFGRPKQHHPTGIAYPRSENRDFFRPTALVDGITFFDTNGNGVADADEVQLFGIGGTLECSSCHREHGDAPPPPQPSMYLRLANGAVCRVCHRA